MPDVGDQHAGRPVDPAVAPAVVDGEALGPVPDDRAAGPTSSAARLRAAPRRSAATPAPAAPCGSCGTRVLTCGTSTGVRSYSAMSACSFSQASRSAAQRLRHVRRASVARCSTHSPSARMDRRAASTTSSLMELLAGVAMMPLLVDLADQLRAGAPGPRLRPGPRSSASMRPHRLDVGGDGIVAVADRLEARRPPTAPAGRSRG